MTSTTAEAGAPKLLRQRLRLLNSVALRQAVAALDGFMRRLGSALLDAASQTGDAAAAQGLQVAAQRLEQERASFQRLFSDCLQQALEREARTLLAPPKSRLRRAALDLTLDSFEAMQRKVEIDNLAQLFDRANARHLTLLRQRLALSLGQEASALANPLANTVGNPFRAEVFLKATIAAWERFESDPGARALLLTQLGPDSFLPLDAILIAVQRELGAQLPATAPEVSARPGSSTLLSTERRLIASPASAVDGALEHLAHSRALPAHTLQLLERLQPVLRVLAESDPRFLIHPRHPGRRLVQLVIQTSLAGGTRSRPSAALRELVEDGASRFEREPDPAWLEGVCAEIEMQLKALLNTVAERREACIVEAERQEREARAERMAHLEVMARLEQGAVPPFVEAFLLKHWVRVLAYAQNVHTSKPALLPKLVQLMDELIWSVQPKDTAAQREQLHARLPTLRSVLDAWLNVIKWEGPARQAFREQLERRHAELLDPTPEPDTRTRLQAQVDALQRASEMDLRTREAEHEEEALLPYMHRIDALAPGDWVEFTRNGGSTVQCRLSWVSATRGRFVFVAPSARMGFVISESLFAQGLRAGRARITTTGEVLQTALAALT